MVKKSASLLLGYDCGSSSIKASIVDSDTGAVVASAQSPSGEELAILSEFPGWAEQDPELWWEHLVLATGKLRRELESRNTGTTLESVAAIGISYQMHGLVLLDHSDKLIRPSIIWCDSRAVQIGERAYSEIGQEVSLRHLKNPPGNFTASRFRWLMENEPRTAQRTKTLFLPGDYIGFRLSGEKQTTCSGLSEMILWDYEERRPADLLLRYFEMSPEILPELVPTFGVQAKLQAEAASLLGMKAGTPITYRAGDQPNNAFSLAALNPGDVASTAGTSAVVYAVSDKAVSDHLGRVNTFVHVNHREERPRFGVLLCVNGSGILYSWIRRLIAGGAALHGYPELNALAAEVSAGSEGLLVLPYGNGAERSLENQDLGAALRNLNFLRHDKRHLIRAAQEGIAFSLAYGLEILRDLDIPAQRLHAGDANLFLSSVFQETLASTASCSIEISSSDGASGAARAAGMGLGLYADFGECFRGLESKKTVEPNPNISAALQESYGRWKEFLQTERSLLENQKPRGEI